MTGSICIKVRLSKLNHLLRSVVAISSLAILGSLSFSYKVQADEPFFGTEKAASVLNQPGVAVEVGKAATNVVQPGIEYLYDWNGEWRTGTSAAIYTYQDVVTLRAGYAVDYLPYVSLPVHLNSALKRFNATKSIGEKLDVVDKYTTVGPWIGKNLDYEEDGNDKDGGLVGGVSFGAKLTF